MSGVVKYHALGNDYLVADPRHSGLAPGPGSARLLCDRHRGVGADGVLYGPLPAGPAGGDEDGGFHVRVFNPDGTECARSGNGLRIFARYLGEHGYTDRDEITLRTPGGSARVRRSGDAGGDSTIDLGGWTHRDPRWPGDPELIDAPHRVAGTAVRVTAVHNGVPHAVVHVDEASPQLAAGLGPLLASGHPGFPDGTNVEFVTAVDRGTLRAEFWERAGGYTLTSGSGACAAACAAHRLGLTGPEVTVIMPGGSVSVRIEDGERVLLTGPCSKVGSTELAEDFLALLHAADAAADPVAADPVARDSATEDVMTG
ncbi:diaminopimelate epimerase [Streptomyces winkii]|uniref:diaminopimelate epimerase n=1 Tax=Streptomyces winkii TaxID=3051178 RepID=UPI0028D34B40|nr:diaminopimelate epimerase [Streptomyces sp. DSM 40971]